LEEAWKEGKFWKTQVFKLKVQECEFVELIKIINGLARHELHITLFV
jgi:hypothetical protein